MTEQTFTLAVPPSVNNLFVTAGNRRVKSKTYAAWMQAARWQIAALEFRLDAIGEDGDRAGAAVAAIADAMRVPANRDRQLRGWRCVPHDFKDTRI